jgi:hypothetical protein
MATVDSARAPSLMRLIRYFFTNSTSKQVDRVAGERPAAVTPNSERLILPVPEKPIRVPPDRSPDRSR